MLHQNSHYIHNSHNSSDRCRYQNQLQRTSMRSGAVTTCIKPNYEVQIQPKSVLFFSLTVPLKHQMLVLVLTNGSKGVILFLMD